MTTQHTRPFPEERRLATVLFADVQGFTNMADRMDFEDVGDLMREVWSLVDNAIEAHGGYIDKHIGDAVMAVWGAPQASEDDAERAVGAALVMQEALAEYAAHSSREGANQLKMRIGINTGLVLAGHMGARGEYTVLGDTVNTASRLETTAEPATTVIGESTYRLVRGAFRMRRLEPLQVKGKANPVEAFVVEGRLDQPGQPRYRNRGGLQTHMVGRNAEMIHLAELYRQAIKTRSPMLGIIRSEAGLGKSRLLMEFTSQLEVTELNLRVLSARCLAQASRVPFFVWKSLWYERFKIKENDPPETAREHFVQGVQTLWGKQPSQTSAAEAAHLIGTLLGLEWPNSPYLAQFQADPQAASNRAFELMSELLRRACSTGSIVLLLDDLQWADNSSLDLLTYLATTPTELPLLILGATRPGVLRKRRDLQNAGSMIVLHPLPAEARVVAEAYPTVAALPESTLAEIARVAEGNPYFMEELVKSLTQFGPARDALGTSRLHQPDHKLPDSLHSTLQARLDVLSPDARGVALLASVVGRVFWVGAVLAAAQQTAGTGLLTMEGPNSAMESMVATGLAELVRAELAFPRSESTFVGEQEYIFKHSLLRDVAYSLLPHKYRRHYHLAVARWLTKYATLDYAATIGEHLEQAGAHLEAAQEYEKSAAHARARGALTEAQWLEGRARELKGLPAGGRPRPSTGSLLG